MCCPIKSLFMRNKRQRRALMKGVMIEEAIAFPFTHDLKELVKRWTSSGQT